MRSLLLLLLVMSAVAQSGLQLQTSHTTENLRGVSAVSRQIVWASGTHGTYLRTTNGGRTWTPAQVPGATALDFRAVVAFSADQAFLMSSGPGDQSRIYHTNDAGKSWRLQFTNSNPKGFFDSMAFWDPQHGVVLGDPIPSENGKLRFELLETDDGQSWHAIPSSQMPEAIEGEVAFAASNTCIAILNSRSLPARVSTNSVIPRGASAPDSNLWFATGGKVSRVFHSPDRGRTWTVTDTPIIHGPDSAGIFSIAFRGALHGVIAGGDYQHPNQDVPNLATTQDGGRTWNLQHISGAPGYLSAVGFSPRNSSRWFLIGPDYILASHQNQHTKYSNQKFNALSPFPERGALVVGPKGAIAVIP